MKYLSDAEIEQLEQSSSSKKYLSDAEMDALEGQSKVAKKPVATDTDNLMSAFGTAAKSGVYDASRNIALGTVGLPSLGFDWLAQQIGSDKDYANPVTKYIGGLVDTAEQARAAEAEAAKQGAAGFTGNLVGSVAGMIPDMLMGGAGSSGMATMKGAADKAIPAIVAQAQKGFAAAQPLAAQAGLSRYEEALDKGNNGLNAATSGLGAYGSMSIQGMAPMGMAGSAGKRIGTGVAANVPLGIGGRQLENLTSPQNMQQDIYDPKAMLADAVLGGTMHGIMGERGAPATKKPISRDIAPDTIPEPTNVQQIRDQIVFSTRALEATKVELQNLERALDNAKTDNQVKRILDQISEKEADIFKHESTIKNLSEHPEIRAEQPTNVPPETVVDTLPINREPSIFRSDDEAFDATRNKQEALSQGEALRKTMQEMADVQAERRALLDKPNKTLEDQLRIAELSDKFDETSVRNDPQNNLVDVIASLREEIADLKQEPDAYTQARLPVAEKLLSKYMEFQRRAEGSVRNEPAKRSSAEIKAEPEPVKQFVPGVTPTEVHSNYIKQIRDYVTTGKFSDEGIQESIDARQERMEIIKHLQDTAFRLASPEGDAKAERYENTLELMRLENANLQAIKDLPHNERQAAFKVLLQHLEGVDYTKLAPEQVTEVMRGIVEHGTLRQGLKTLAENSTSPLLRTVAGFLHNNPKIGRFVKLHYDSKLEHPASASQRDKVEISFRDPSDVKSTHFVHEALHAATSGMMMAWRAGHKFPEPVTKALQNIQDLHTDLKGKLNLNFVNAIYTELYLNAKESGQPINHEKLAADAKLHADEALKNERELLAYGNSHQTIADALSRVEIAPNKSAAKRLYESVATALGFGNKEATTALQKLMDNSQTLIEHSEGMSFKQITGRDTTAEDYTREYRTVTGDIGFKSSNKFLQGLADFGAGFGRRVFITPSNLKNYYNHPFIHKIADAAERAQRESTMVFNEVMTGDPTFAQFKAHLKGKMFSMSKALDERGLEYAINNTPVKAIGQVARLMDVVIRDGITWEQALQQKLPGATPAQINFAKSMDRAANILLTRANEMLTARGLQPIKEASGYVIRNLVGRYYTDKTYNGEIFERRYFASEAEAKAYAKSVMQSDPLVNAAVSKRDPKANFEDITRVLDDIIAQAREGVGPAQYAAAKRETIKSQASSVGGHKIHRGLVHNFMGGLTDDASLGKAFADSLSQGVGEYTNSIRLRQIAADTAQDMHGQSSEVTKARYPNAFKVAQYFLDNEMNRLDHNKFTESIAPFTDFVNETVNNITFNTFGKRLSSDVIAKSWQDLTRVAYNLKLTSAPVTWLAQSMATLQASRGVFKEGARFIDGMGAMSKGILRTLFKQYDNDAIKGLYHVSQNLDTFHKHTINDSTIGQMSKKTSFDEFRKWVLGEKFTEGSDSFSRIAAYNISYEALKSMGWKAGDVATYEKAAEMATENMIAMGKKSLPGIYKELGFLGTSQAPLRGYMHGAFANLAVDVKDVILNHDKASALALTANMMSIMLLGGVLGAPFLADYEYLRQLLTKSGAIAYDTLPHWTKLAESLPNWASHGVISDLTGVDMGASMRYNSIFKPFGDVAEATNLANLSLQLGTATDVVGSAFGVAKDIFGNQPDEAARVNWNKLLPRGPAKAIKEEIYDYRGASVAGTRGDKLVDRGPTERVATLLGSSSIKEAKTRTAREEDRVKTEQINLRKQKAVDLILSPNQSDKQAGRQLIQKMVQAKDITGEEAASLVMGRMVKRNRPVLENMMSTKPGGVPSTLPQARKARDLLPYLQE